MRGLAPAKVYDALDARFPEAVEYARRLLRQPSISATVEAIEAQGKQPDVWPSSGGAMPAFAFQEYLRLPWVATGLGHGAHAQGAKRKASIDGMRRFMAGEAFLVCVAARHGRKRAR